MKKHGFIPLVPLAFVVAMIFPPRAFADSVELVSVGSNMEALLYGSTPARVVSNDGRFVAFRTPSALVADDTNNGNDIYVRDRLLDRIVRVSVGNLGEQAPGYGVTFFSISGSGRFVAFVSSAANFAAADTDSYPDVFLRDRDADGNGVFDESFPGATSTSLASVISKEPQWFGGDCRYPTMSDDGRYTAFQLGGYIWVFDRTTGITQAANLKSDGTYAYNTWFPFISGDGTNVGWVTTAKAVPEDTDSMADVYVRDLVLGRTVRASVSYDGQPGGEWWESNWPVLSHDGRFVLFYSTANNIVPGDANGQADLFVRDRDADGDGVFDEAGAMTTTRVNISSDGIEGNGALYGWSLSADGRFVTFGSRATNLATECTSSLNKVFLHNRDADGNGVYDETGGFQTTVISKADDGSCANSEAYTPGISADGAIVAFVSDASNLVPGTAGTNVFAVMRSGIEILSAVFDYVNDTLHVTATTPAGASDDLVLVGYGPMTWNAGSSVWELTVEDVVSAPTSLSVAGRSGSVTLQ